MSMMRNSALLLLATALGAAAFSGRKTSWRDLAAKEYAYSFDEYLAEYGKSYADPEEYAARKDIFEASLVTIKAHNEGGNSWKMGLSPHVDKHAHEWAMLKGYGRTLAALNQRTTTQARANVDISALPASIDWRTKGVVTQVKDQGGCGSCWAFSATEVLESHIALNTGKPVQEYAPQEFVDCAPDPKDCGGTGGCEGSTQWLAFNYTIRAGVVAAADYPYKATDGTCMMDSLTTVGGITGYQRLAPNDYSALMNAVATIGPIAISVDASWSFYEEGVYDSACGTTIDHAVVLVGYGTEDGLDYWLVRNSWGTSWGDEGYIKIKRFGEGQEPCGEDLHPGDGTACKPYPTKQKVCGLCGILSDSSYPTGGYTK